AAVIDRRPVLRLDRVRKRHGGEILCLLDTCPAGCKIVLLFAHETSVTLTIAPLDVVGELNEKTWPGRTVKYSHGPVVISVPMPPAVEGVLLLPVASMLIQPPSCVATRT